MVLYERVILVFYIEFNDDEEFELEVCDFSRGLVISYSYYVGLRL